MIPKIVTFVLHHTFRAATVLPQASASSLKMFSETGLMFIQTMKKYVFEMQQNSCMQAL